MLTKRFSSLLSWPSGMRFSKSALNSCSFTQWIMGGKQKSCYGGKCTLTLLCCCWGPKENTWTPSNSGKAPCGLTWRAASGSMTMSSCSCRSTLWAEVTKLHWLASQCHPLDCCKKAGPASEEEVAWVRTACHRCRLYLGDLFHFQNEFPALATKDLADRCDTEPCQWPCTWACPSTSWGLSQGGSTMTLKPRTLPALPLLRSAF